LKDLVDAKTRLAGLLRSSERRALAQAMAEDVLGVLAGHPGIGRIVLVSDDPGANMLAREYAAECWAESELGCRGLNAVLECASARLSAAGGDAQLILHADLPLLAARDVGGVLDALAGGAALVAGPDRHGAGTNLLAFDAGAAPRFCFGIDSFARHTAVAGQAGTPVRVVRSVGIGLDIDEPRDLTELLARGPIPGSRTGALLAAGLGSRLALTLGAGGEVGRAGESAP